MRFRHPLLLALTLGGCATTGATTAARSDTVTVSVGPCFGFCPVYSVAIGADGHVAFDGERHTAILDHRDREAGQGARDAIAALAAFRPADGSDAETQCDQRISDQQTYRIIWTGPDGRKTMLSHDKGCRSPRNDALNAVLTALPDTLGIADWAKQTTRQGVSRG